MSYIQNQIRPSNGVKKSLYIFLCALLGILLFLIIHRLAIFGYLVLVNANPLVFAGSLSYLEILAIDFSTLVLALLLGMWYGIALGLKWYEAVYEQKEHGGLVDYLIKTYWPSQKAAFDLPARVQSVARELKDDVLELEHLAKTIKPVIRETKPIKRRIVRKKASVGKQVIY